MNKAAQADSGHEARGLAFLETEQFEAAAAEFRKGIAAQSDSTRLRFLLGEALEKWGARFDEAAAVYEELLRLNPGHAEAHLRLGAILEYNVGDDTRALSLYQRYLELDPNSPRRAEVERWIHDLRQSSAAFE